MLSGCHPSRRKMGTGFSRCDSFDCHTPSGHDLRFLPVLQILEWQEAHEIGVVDYVRLCRPYHMISFTGMRCDDMTDSLRYTALHRETDTRKRMPDILAERARNGFAIDFVVFEQFSNIGEDRT